MLSTKGWKRVGLLAFLTSLAASPAALAEDPTIYFNKIAGQIAACFQKDGTMPRQFNEELECWTLTPDTGPGFSATLNEYTRRGEDLYAGDYAGTAQFQYGDARCSFSLSFDYSGEDITGSTLDFTCTGS